MDPRDSSRSISAAGRDGLFTNDDGISSIVAAISRNATLLFQSQRFSECVDALNQLLTKKRDDPKVLHNIVIAKYFINGCSDPRKLLESLYKLKERSEAMAHGSVQQSDGAYNLGNKIVVGSKGNNVTPSAINSRIAFTDEFETSVATLNIATIWFHLHEYKMAHSVLEPLYQKIEPLYEDMINYLEKAFGEASRVEYGAVQQSSKISLAPTNTTTDSLVTSGSARFGDLVSPMDIGGHSLSRSCRDCSPYELSKTLVDRSDLKLKLQFYRVRFLLLTRNIKAAKHEVKILMNISRGGDSSMALLLKSQLEYARGNYKKAVKLLTGSTHHTEVGFSIIFNSNLGCIYYHLGKPHVSAIFFARALASVSSLGKEKPSKLSSFSRDKSLQILYNCGIQHLACKKPLLAADCFQKSSEIFYNRPILWIRIAECCLMGHEKKLEGKPVKALVIGKGKWRNLLVEDIENDDADDDDDVHGHVPVPQKGKGKGKLSITLAHQCLLTALQLLKLKDTTKVYNITVGSIQVSANSDKKGRVLGLSNTLQNSLSCYEELCRRDENMLKQAVLAYLAYLDLEMENPLKALSTADSLLSLSNCSKTYFFLGHIYAAEALCLLNRPKEAVGHLARCLHGGRLVDSEDKDLKGGSLTQEDAAGALYVNFAAACVLRGKVDQARGFTERALSMIPKRREAVLASVYVDLVAGRSEEGLAKLKRCEGVGFSMGNLVESW